MRPGMHVPTRRRLAVACLVAGAVFAQTAPAPPARTRGPEEAGQTAQPAEPIATVTARGVDEAPEFEAASVKISQPGALNPGRIQGMQGGPGSRDPGLFQCTSCTLRLVLLRAYDLQPYSFSVRLQSMKTGTTSSRSCSRTRRGESSL